MTRPGTRRALLGAGLLVAVGLACAVGLGWDSFYGRFIRGISTVAVENRSGKRLHDVRLTVRWGDGNERTIVFNEMQPGEMRKLPVRTSDLYLRSLSFVLNGTAHAPQDAGGIACTGETAVFAIGPEGNVKWYNLQE
jgi:hypothetical protein